MPDGKAFLRLNKLFLSMEEFRKFDPQMPIQMAATFLFFAIHRGCTMRQLADATEISQSSASRNVAALSETHRAGSAGHNLLVSEQDPLDWRRKVINLTPKGQRMAATLLALMEK